MSSRIFHLIGRPPRVNDNRRAHWSKERITQRYRILGLTEGHNREAVTPPVEIHVQPVVAGGNRADAGACYEVVKAFVDGLVDAGLMPDDGPDFVKCIHLHAPELGEDDRLIVEVLEI